LQQVVQRKTGRNFYNIGPFKVLSQEVHLYRRYGMTELASKTCVPCKGGVPPLKGEQLDALRRQVPEWEVAEEHHLRQHFRFKNFREALDFVNKVGELAEEQGHHPDIYFGWGRVEVLVWTHKINGLTESDFIFAAKVDRL
jgi:4a-hydroxytetrahydrobiopterin dehydratase